MKRVRLSLAISYYLHGTGLILISLLVFSCSLPMISEQDEKRVWEGVKCECPDCRDIEKPNLQFTYQPLYQDINNRKTEVMGMYIPSQHTIILRENADIIDYEHECRHVCKDDKWDEYYHSWITWERDMFFPIILNTPHTVR